LRGRIAQDQVDEAVIVDLVDQRFGGLARPAAGDRMDDAERVEEGIDRVDHQQEEGGRREQREDDGPEALGLGRAPSMAAASISDFGNGLQAGDEEQEIVADLLPGGGGHDQHHRLVAVEQRVPVMPIARSSIGQRAESRG
jgi:hypothetical protein